MRLRVFPLICPRLPVLRLAHFGHEKYSSTEKWFRGQKCVTRAYLTLEVEVFCCKRAGE